MNDSQKSYRSNTTTNTTNKNSKVTFGKDPQQERERIIIPTTHYITQAIVDENGIFVRLATIEVAVAVGSGCTSGQKSHHYHHNNSKDKNDKVDVLDVSKKQQQQQQKEQPQRTQRDSMKPCKSNKKKKKSNNSNDNKKDNKHNNSSSRIPFSPTKQGKNYIYLPLIEEDFVTTHDDYGNDYEYSETNDDKRGRNNRTSSSQNHPNPLDERSFSSVSSSCYDDDDEYDVVVPVPVTGATTTTTTTTTTSSPEPELEEEEEIDVKAFSRKISVQYATLH